MKKGLVLIGCLLALIVGAATIQWYSDQPATSSPADTDIIALERPSPHAYKSATLAVLKAYIGTNGTLVISNFFAERGTNVYLNVQYAFFTNVYAPFITNNFFYTTNIYATYSTNQYAYITNLIATYLTVLSNAYFYQTNFVNYQFTTNEYVTILQVQQMTNAIGVFTNIFVYGDLDVDNLYVGNAFIQTNNVSDQWLTNGMFRFISTWLGPSNTYYLNTNRYYYVTWTPCAVTNFAGTTAGWSADSAITYSNAASTNVTITISAANYWSGDATNQYTLTNSEVMDLALESDGTVYIKGLSRTFHKQQ